MRDYNDLKCTLAVDFLTQQVKLGKSPKTIDSYYLNLKDFLNTVFENKEEVTLGDIKKLTVSDFLDKWLYIRQNEGISKVNGKKGLSASSLNMRLKVLSSFYNYLITLNRGINVNIPKNIPYFTDNKNDFDANKIVFLEKEEVAKMYQALKDINWKNDFIATRNDFMSKLFLVGGLRVSELAGLKIENYNLKEDYIIVLGKGSDGGKKRKIYIDPRMKKLYLKYMVERGKVMTNRNDDEGYMFVSERQQNMDRISITNLIKYIGKCTKLEKQISAHTLRHTFATTQLSDEDGMTLQEVSETLGHTNVNTTGVYIHALEQGLKKNLNNSLLDLD